MYLGRKKIRALSNWDRNIRSANNIIGFLNIVRVEQGMERPRGDKTQEKRSGIHWSGTLHHGIARGQAGAIEQTTGEQPVPPGKPSSCR
jgi:hypothetical protein